MNNGHHTQSSPKELLSTQLTSAKITDKEKNEDKKDIEKSVASDNEHTTSCKDNFEGGKLPKEETQDNNSSTIEEKIIPVENHKAAESGE